MTTLTPSKPAPAPVAAPENPYFGQGGSYRFDPATGLTTLASRAGLESTTAPAIAPAAPAATDTDQPQE